MITSPVNFTHPKHQFLTLALTGLLSLGFWHAVGQSQPASSFGMSPATVFLDFDGHQVRGTSWNIMGDIDAQPADLTEAAMTEIFNRVSEDYRIFNLNITTDSSVYDHAPVTQRIRILITPTSAWYGNAAGCAFVNSFNWGDGTPAWVFSNLLSDDPKYIAEAASHEIGHTLGLQHQSVYGPHCELLNEYAEGKGDGETGWAPIMGVGYYKNVTTWHNGTSVEGCNVIQNDIDILSNGLHHLGLRPDDHGNSPGSATPVVFHGPEFRSAGTISSEMDKDVFSFILDHPSLLKANIVPYHVGDGNAGANIDLKMSLLAMNGDIIDTSNPKGLLGASFDTSLAAGSYYLAIDGVGNSNLDDYGSIGHYILSGSVQVVLPLIRMELKGKTVNYTHVISWSIEADAVVKDVTVECSSDGTHFKNMAVLSPRFTTFTNRYPGTGILYYRIKMTAGEDDKPFYSNIINLQSPVPDRITLLSHIVRSRVVVTTGQPSYYQLLDETGRLFTKGILATGLNHITLNTAKRGILLLKIYNSNEQVLFKLIRQ